MENGKKETTTIKEYVKPNPIYICKSETSRVGSYEICKPSSSYPPAGKTGKKKSENKQGPKTATCCQEKFQITQQKSAQPAHSTAWFGHPGGPALLLRRRLRTGCRSGARGRATWTGAGAGAAPLPLPGPRACAHRSAAARGTRSGQAPLAPPGPRLCGHSEAHTEYVQMIFFLFFFFLYKQS